MRESALNFRSGVRHRLEDEHLPGIERPFSRAPEVDLVFYKRSSDFHFGLSSLFSSSSSSSDYLT